MPVITALTDPTNGRVLIDTDWSDTPGVGYVRVLRVGANGCEEVAVRTHTASASDVDYIRLSCGRAILYDSEAPLDTPFTYQALGLGAVSIPAHRLATSFTQVATVPWGGTSTPTGQVWAVQLGGAAQFTLGSNAAHILVEVTNTRRIITTTAPADVWTNADGYYTVSVPVLALTQPITAASLWRYIDLNNLYRAELSLATTGAVTASIIRRAGGVDTTLSTVLTGVTYAANTQMRVRVRILGTSLMMKVWLAGTTEPATWTTTATDTVIAGPGTFGFRGFLNAGNTNVLPVSVDFDDVDFREIDAVSTVLSGTVTVASNGNMWLKDPLHPCNSTLVTLLTTQDPLCTPSIIGVVFASMDDERRAAQGSVVGRQATANPVAATRLRAGVTSALNLVSRTFASRDRILAELAPGTPLLFQTPQATYGIPDRYMFVGDVGVSRLTSDHRRPWRMLTLPYTTVDSPVGFSEGVCGARWTDSCDIYATWGAVTAAGFTWVQAMYGVLSTNPSTTTFRTWDQVNVEFASWTVLAATGKTWNDVLEFN
jgi:hypothetical protein